MHWFLHHLYRIAQTGTDLCRLAMTSIDLQNFTIICKWHEMKFFIIFSRLAQICTDLKKNLHRLAKNLQWLALNSDDFEKLKIANDLLLMNLFYIYINLYMTCTDLQRLAETCKDLQKLAKTCTNLHRLTKTSNGLYWLALDH